MIKRTKLHILCTSLFLAAAVASPAAAGSIFSGMSPLAQETAENVIETLESSGYTIVSVKRTLLRRLRITASDGARTREVIVSRTTGEIRRDSVFQIALSDERDTDTFKGDGGDATRTAAVSDDDNGDTSSTSKNDGGNLNEGETTSGE